MTLLQTVESNQRRKDIYQALTLNMGEIFSFLVQLIETHVTKFRDFEAQGRPREESAPHVAVVQVSHANHLIMSLKSKVWIPNIRNANFSDGVADAHRVR